MARLDLESSGESGGYSDSFEIEENISLDLTESSTESDARNSVESQLKKTLTSGIRTRGQSTGITTTKTTTASPNEFRSESHNSSVILDSGSVDLGRTIRSPVYITEQSASRGLKRPNFNQAAQKVHTMQSVVNTAKNFNDSLEVRDSVYGEWLARKAGQVSREKNLKVIAKKMEEEKKREKEVNPCYISLLLLIDGTV